MIKMAEVVKGALEVLGLTRKTEASRKKPCELEEAKYDTCTNVLVNQGRKWKEDGFREVKNRFVNIFWLP
jgi:hypothetical protein